jgi:hypothetical protein
MAGAVLAAHGRPGAQPAPPAGRSTAPVPVATAARDHAANAGLCPAQAVWATTSDGDRRRLADLAHLAADLREHPTGAAA